MLREESRLDQVADLAGGSWAVETLTHQLCVAAWKLFQEVDAMGGLKAALEAAFPQAKIAEVAAARRKAIAQRTARQEKTRCAEAALQGVVSDELFLNDGELAVLG